MNKMGVWEYARSRGIKNYVFNIMNVPNINPESKLWLSISHIIAVAWPSVTQTGLETCRYLIIIVIYKIFGFMPINY